MDRKTILALSVVLTQVMLVGVSAAQGSGQAFFLSLHYDEGEFSLTDVFVKTSGPVGDPIGAGPLVYEVVSFDGDVLYSSRFSPPLPEHSDGPVYVMNIQKDLLLVIPYYPDSEEIRVMNGLNETLLSVNVTPFASEIPRAPAADEPPYLSYVAIAAVILVVCFALYFLFLHRRTEDAFGSLTKKWS